MKPQGALDSRIESLLLHKPYLRVYFQSLPESPSFCLSQGKKEHSQVFQLREGRKIALSSLRYPEQEVRNIFEKAQPLWQDGELLIVLGIANLALLQQIQAKRASKQICILVDFESELAQMLMQQEEGFLDFLCLPNCHLFCGAPQLESLWQYIANIPMSSFRGMSFLVNPASFRLSSLFYKDLQAKIAALLRSRISDLLTRLEFSHLWVRNTLLNSRYLAAKHAPKAQYDNILGYKDALKGLPGVLIASGPTLGAQMPALRYLRKEGCFLLCVDTAYQILAKRMDELLKPHAVMTLDAQVHTLFAFLGTQLKDTLVFADLVSNPLVLRELEARGRSSPDERVRVIFSASASMIPDLQGQIREESTVGSSFATAIHGPVGSLESGGSVSTSAFGLLRFLGCSPIFLAGLDHAYVHRNYYNLDTYHTQAWLSKSLCRHKGLSTIMEELLQRRQLRRVPAVPHGEVLSDPILQLYQQWFEEKSFQKQGIYQLGQGQARFSKESGIQVLSELRQVQDALATHTQSCASKREAQVKLAFMQTPYLEPQEHPLFYELLRALERSLQPSGRSEALAMSEFAWLYESFPFLCFAQSKAELYIQRNLEKLDVTSHQGIVDRQSRQSLMRLLRSLRPFGDSSTKVHTASP